MNDVVTIDDVEYKVEDLSDASKAIISRLNYISNEVYRANANLDILRAADMQLKAVLKETLTAPESEEEVA